MKFLILVIVTAGFCAQSAMADITIHMKPFMVTSYYNWSNYTWFMVYDAKVDVTLSENTLVIDNHIGPKIIAKFDAEQRKDMNLGCANVRKAHVEMPDEELIVVYRDYFNCQMGSLPVANMSLITHSKGASSYMEYTTKALE